MYVCHFFRMTSEHRAITPINSYNGFMFKKDTG